MSTCVKCGGYFSVTKQTMFCHECEQSNTNNVSNCDIPMPQGFGEQKGWICPVCGRGVAPWMNWCPCQKDGPINTVKSNAGEILLNEHSKILNGGIIYEARLGSDEN